jgi:hypothetical protein
MTPTLPPDSDSLESTPDELRAQLRELTGKSWNLELIISGAALFATLRLPDVLTEVYEYYRYNLLLQRGTMYESLPSLMFSLTKATSYVLFGAFLLNFVMRAYWVSLVGLLAVYPSGIHYDRIPFYTDATKTRLAAELGPLSGYIRRLDRRCNTVFSLAFLLVIMLLLIAFAYGLFVGIATLERAVFPAWFVSVLNAGLLIGYGSLVLAVAVLGQGRFRHSARLAKWQYRLQRVGRLFFFGLYKPVSYAILMFSSNVPRGQYLRGVVLFFVGVGTVINLELQVDLSRRKGSSMLLNDRLLYTTRTDDYRLNADAYHNRRLPNTLVASAAIQSEIVREPYLNVFLAYPKSLDALMAEASRPPAPPDSLSRETRNRQQAAWSVAQLGRAFAFYVDDSLYTPPGLLFTELGERQQRGLETLLLLPVGFRPGPHRLRVTVQGFRQPKPIDYAVVPFWFVPR